MSKKYQKFFYSIFCLLALAAVFVSYLAFQKRAEKIEIDFFDVGQGDSVLINAPNGNQVLADGGPTDAVLQKLGQELPLGDKTIELLILTHPDADHLNGLIEVLKKYKVEKILETGITDSTANYQEWQSLIEQRQIPVVFAQVGQTVRIADNLAIKILYPLGKINGQNFGDSTNRSSIVAKLIYGANEILLTGDIEADGEAAMLLAKENVTADILQVAHHGSKSSSSADFLAAVASKIAVIQVGKNNRYGHPTQEVISRLGQEQILRTDLDGDIKFECDLKRCVRAR